MQILLSHNGLLLVIKRLSQQILELQEDLQDVVLIGIQPRGVFISDLIIAEIKNIRGADKIQYGLLDITFYRDDVRKEIHVANKTDINFSIEGKRVILIDDVLYTGRTARAALDALQDFGRPAKVELCVLIDRRFERELPIQPDYVGKRVDTHRDQKVFVDKENSIVFLT